MTRDERFEDVAAHHIGVTTLMIPTVGSERAVSTLASLAEITRLPTSALIAFLYWANGDGDGWAEALHAAGTWREIVDTYSEPIVATTANLVRDEAWWPIADAAQTRWVVATIVRHAGWSDAHL